MIYTLADSGVKIHRVNCRYVTPAYPILEFASAQHLRRWVGKRNRVLCAHCKPLEKE